MKMFEKNSKKSHNWEFLSLSDMQSKYMSRLMNRTNQLEPNSYQLE